MAKPNKIAHIVMRTRQYDKMIAWYEKVFEAQVRHQNEVIAFLTFDDEHHRLAFINLAAIAPDNNEPQTNNASGIDHVAFTFDDLDALMNTYERLKTLGIEPYWPIHHGITISFYYQDPDGNRIEFQAERFDTMAEGSAYMRSDAFVNNSIGVNFNAEEFAARYKAGASKTDLFTMPEGPPATIPPEHGIG